MQPRRPTLFSPPRFRAFGMGLALALFAACSSQLPLEPTTEDRSASGEGLEETAVTGSRVGQMSRAERERADRAAAISGSGAVARSAAGAPPAAMSPLAASAGGPLQEITVSAAGIDRTAGIRQFAERAARRAPLSRAQPGEEIWVIATGRDDLSRAIDVDDSEPGSGAMLALVASTPDRAPQEIPLPLKHTDVHAVVTGYVGTVDVTQQFENPYDEKIEAVYLFPLPEKAAVSEFVMTIGERKIRGILREKQEAEQIYRDARAQGYQASLLTQHRPNVFEQKVANIEPGKRIDVNIRYFHTLAYEDGWYSFVFPTVVGPRYNPRGSVDPVVALPREDVTEFTNGAAVRYLRPNERSAHDISIAVDVDAGVAIEELDASHQIRTVRHGRNAARVELASQTTMPNRDFILNFRVAGETVKSNLLTYTDPDTSQGYFTLMVYPPAGLDALRRQPVEMVFVLDTSGSMDGRPLGQAIEAVVEALDRLRSSDTFQILNFSDSVGQLGSAPLPATAQNLELARGYLRGLDSRGGTQMINGIRAALGFPHDPRRVRFVTFLTDGYIGNEAEILGEVHRLIGAARIFSFGVGDSVNRYLLDGLAREGRGAVAYLGLDDSAKEVMGFFFERISHPALSDVEIDWKGMRASDVYPARLPDLFVGRPVVITGKFLGEPGEIVVRGRAAANDLALPISATQDAPERSFIRNIWARLRIEDLANRQTWTHDPQGELARAIRETALEYGLMSEFTAFIAVDASERTAGERGTTVYQAVPVPNGVRYDTTVAEE
ncbi:MAG TPA: VIT and VWA domain-containing protein [Gammaproteobacteria bacterium]|nr:VIT and VWA domain-containing protein [Gammaproteobacteria bacterium]